jgi:hypothetical protein
MDSFIAEKCKKCFQIVRMLRAIRPKLTTSTATLLANSLVNSRLDYCNSLLINADKSKLQKLQKVMNFTARVVMKCNRIDHISPVLSKLKWINVQNRMKMKIAKFIFLALRHNLPDKLCEQIQTYVPQRSLRSSESKSITLVSSSYNKKVGKGSLKVSGPRIWNQLSETVRERDIKFDTFINRLQLSLSD